jgi:hypothetical protein
MRRIVRQVAATLATAAVLAASGAAVGGGGHNTVIANTEPVGGSPAPTSAPVLTATLT